MKQWNNNRNQTIIKLFFGLFILYIVVKLILALNSSYFINPPQRINILFYGPQSQIISFGVKDGINYIVNFNNDIYLNVPGGYGLNKIGALGRLSNIEKKPELIAKTFMVAIGANIDSYLIPKKNQIYDNDSNNRKTIAKLSNINRLILPINYLSDSAWFDRIYLSVLLLRLNQTQLISLNTSATYDVSKRKIFNDNGFSRRYTGFFFQPKFRDEAANLRIYYQTYKIAKNISRILEGEGIRVVDLELIDKKQKQCRLLTGQQSISKFPKTINFIANKFGCRIKIEEVGGVDIGIILGSRVEKEW